MNMKQTKYALLTSVIALLLCVTMLIGTTFAWFNDSVKSSGNKIQSGTLDVDLFQLVADNDWSEITEAEEPIFDMDDPWEPNDTEFAVLKIVNNGSLALKWQAVLTHTNELSILADVIDVYTTTAEMNTLPTSLGQVQGWTKVGTVREFIEGFADATKGNLEAGKAAYLGIALHMQETAGNDYQGKDLGGIFDIQITATQYTSETDGFGNSDYDAAAPLARPMYSTPKPVVDGDNDNLLDDAIELPLENVADSPIQDGTAKLPKDTKTTDDSVSWSITPAANPAEDTVAKFDDREVDILPLNISVEGLADDNTEVITITATITSKPASVALFHNGVAMAPNGNETIDGSYQYNAATGELTIYSSKFSPFDVVSSELPIAVVTDITEEYKEYDWVWDSFGGFGPSKEELKNIPLDVVYRFAAQDTAATAALSPYTDWYADYYVSLDADLGPNQLFLGGNYGEYLWIGFDVSEAMLEEVGGTLPANTPVGLLAFAGGDLTYQGVVEGVSVFSCGAADINDALKDKTLTVELRLTNPENADEYFVVNSIDYTF